MDSAKESTPEMKAACPTLRYSCCSEHEAKHLIDQIVEGLDFKNFQSLFTKKMFEVIDQIPEETFKVFLSEMTKDDIKCYDEMKINITKYKFGTLTSTLSTLNLFDSLKVKHEFDIDKIMKNFKALKDLTDPYIKSIEELYEERKEYYSGFVCSACSPALYKNFKKNDDGDYELEVNKFLCKKVVKLSINAIKNNYIYDYIQELISLSYCTRKHSKKELYSYENVDWKDNVLFFFDPNKIPGYLEHRRECLNVDDAFEANTVKNIDCNDYCRSSLGFFDIKITNIIPIIRIENNLRQMFTTDGNKEEAKKRLQKHFDKFYKKKKEAEQKGIITMNPGNKSGSVKVLRLVPNHKIDFSKMKISVSPYSGLNFDSTPMNEEFFKSSRIVSYFTVLGLFMLFHRLI
jgi:hypothetical protein